MNRVLALMLPLATVVACRDPIEASDALLPPLTRTEGPPAEYQTIQLTLPNLSPNRPGWAVAINDTGQVVGELRAPDGTCPCPGFFWQDDTAQTLGTLGGDRSHPAALNEVGQVVGRSTTAGGQFHAFLWENGVMRDLGTLHGGTSEAIQINDKGQVIGMSDGQAFLWEGGTMQALPLTAWPTVIPGFERPRGAVINNKGEIAGWVTDASGKRRAALWRQGTLTDLGTLGGDESWANAINKKGVIVGASRTATGELHAFRWDNGHMTDLGLPPGWTSAEATFVNKHGGVSGRGRMSGDLSDGRAFSWSDGAIVDIDIGPFSGRAQVDGLNKRGLIVGWTAYGRSASDRAAIVFQDGVLRRIPTPRSYSRALAVNDHGAVVGYVAGDPSSNTRIAVLWLPTSTTMASAGTP